MALEPMEDSIGTPPLIRFTQQLSDLINVLEESIKPRENGRQCRSFSYIGGKRLKKRKQRHQLSNDHSPNDLNELSYPRFGHRRFASSDRSQPCHSAALTDLRPSDSEPKQNIARLEQSLEQVDISTRRRRLNTQPNFSNKNSKFRCRRDTIELDSEGTPTTSFSTGINHAAHHRIPSETSMDHDGGLAFSTNTESELEGSCSDNGHEGDDELSDWPGEAPITTSSHSLRFSKLLGPCSSKLIYASVHQLASDSSDTDEEVNLM